MQRRASQDEPAARADGRERLVLLRLDILDTVALINDDQVGPRILQQSSDLLRALRLAADEGEKGLEAYDAQPAAMVLRGRAILYLATGWNGSKRNALLGSTLWRTRWKLTRLASIGCDGSVRAGSLILRSAL